MAQAILNEQYKINAFTNPLCPIVTTNPSLEIAYWGLIPHWTKSVEDAKKIRNMCLNARSETVFDKNAFRTPIHKKRCLIPATGYFEYHHENKEKIPYFIYLPDEEIFSIGGVYEIWQNPYTTERTQTFSILTVPANDLCAKIHNGGGNPYRMPLIIGKEYEKLWFDASLKQTDIQQFFQPFDNAQMDAYPVSKDFLKKRPNDPSIIERAA